MYDLSLLGPLSDVCAHTARIVLGVEHACIYVYLKISNPSTVWELFCVPHTQLQKPTSQTKTKSIKQDCITNNWTAMTSACLDLGGHSWILHYASSTSSLPSHENTTASLHTDGLVSLPSPPPADLLGQLHKGISVRVPGDVHTGTAHPQYH